MILKNHRLGDQGAAYPTQDYLEKAKDRAGKIERFAETEKRDGFPQLFGIAVVRLWSIAEALVDELTTEALLDPAGCADHPLLSKPKGPLIEFRKASQEEQAESLVESLSLPSTTTTPLGSRAIRRVDDEAMHL